MCHRAASFLSPFPSSTATFPEDSHSHQVNHPVLHTVPLTSLCYFLNSPSLSDFLTLICASAYKALTSLRARTLFSISTLCLTKLPTGCCSGSEEPVSCSLASPLCRPHRPPQMECRLLQGSLSVRLGMGLMPTASRSCALRAAQCRRQTDNGDKPQAGHRDPSST